MCVSVCVHVHVNLSRRTVGCKLLNWVLTQDTCSFAALKQTHKPWKKKKKKKRACDSEKQTAWKCSLNFACNRTIWYNEGHALPSSSSSSSSPRAYSCKRAVSSVSRMLKMLINQMEMMMIKSTHYYPTGQIVTCWISCCFSGTQSLISADQKAEASLTNPIWNPAVNFAALAVETKGNVSRWQWED